MKSDALYLGQSAAETVDVVFTCTTVCAKFVGQRLQSLKPTDSIHTNNIRLNWTDADYML